MYTLSDLRNSCWAAHRRHLCEEDDMCLRPSPKTCSGWQQRSVPSNPVLTLAVERSQKTKAEFAASEVLVDTSNGHKGQAYLDEASVAVMTRLEETTMAHRDR